MAILGIEGKVFLDNLG
uniref:Uncharacterized protein n=1 Tax=Rhizophora mucronata TaxID=61149 RepID=A0A2P2J1T4_RHIMU